MQQVAFANEKTVQLRPAPLPPLDKSIPRDAIRNAMIRDDDFLFTEKMESKEEFNFLTIHDYFGMSWKEVFKRKKEEKEKTELPLIVL